VSNCRPRGRHREGRSRADIKLGPMAGASDGSFLRVDGAITQWSTIVRADVIERIEVPRGVYQDDQPVVDFDQHLAGVGKLGDFGDWNEFAHGICRVSRVKAFMSGGYIDRLGLNKTAG
jgi:hypothetical protein